MDHLDISIKAVGWDTQTLPDIATRAIIGALKECGIPAGTAEISLLACDDAQIAELNADFRDKPTPTNVLSWPSEERAAPHPGGSPATPVAGPDGLMSLGDIAISYTTCAAEADAAGKTIEAHVTHLIVHGTLHLLGYDHETEPDAALMEALEVKILGKLGLDDPYRNP